VEYGVSIPLDSDSDHLIQVQIQIQVLKNLDPGSGSRFKMTKNLLFAKKAKSFKKTKISKSMLLGVGLRNESPTSRISLYAE
jgi:hypothetical protein